MKNELFDGVLRLVPPSIEHKQAALEYKQEYIDAGEKGINGSSSFMKATDYESWLEAVNAGRTTPATGNVAASTYFAVFGGKIVGTIQVRHALNDNLLATGGHVGYGVRPCERRKGYATRMLTLALKKCGELSISRVLVTCNRGNICSEKTILRCGGVYENEVAEENGNLVCRFWIANE